MKTNQQPQALKLPVSLYIPQLQKQPGAGLLKKSKFGHPSWERRRGKGPLLWPSSLSLLWEDKVLLCKRAIEPRLGYWTLPAGFMECGETTLEAAIRETLEEANARVEVESLFTVFNLPHVDQIYMMFKSRLLDLDFSPGAESQEVMLYDEASIPWDDLAFRTIKETLRLFYEDRKRGIYRQHTGDITRIDGVYGFRPGPSELD